MTTNRQDFDGVTAIVTGGSSGIGAAVVRELRDRGAKVAVLDVDPEPVSAGDPNVRAWGCDVRDDESVRGAVAAVASTFGGVDVLINNAGIGSQGAVEDNADDEWDRVLDVNLLGVVRVSRACLPHLRRSKSPAIVNMGSIAATQGLAQRAVYSATKGAVHALTRAMAVDNLLHGVRVNVVAPGTADTPWVERLLQSAADPKAERAALESRQPHGRLVTAEEVAVAVANLASPRSGSTNGVTFAVDGGMDNLVPRRPA
jgi:2-keto-3-deoxy-L-fuconate dehydrogenase